MNLARKRGLKVVERTIMPEELGTFSECFLTGTAGEVSPVSEIAQHKYKPGRICELLINDYTAAVQPKREAAE
jgi:branched-chain amino acid aminotransferase